MERDWEVIRRVLAELEAKPVGEHLECSGVPGIDPAVVSYHIWLLDQAGFVEARCRSGLSGPMMCAALSLKWSGHELLDTIRSDTVWNKTKAVLKEKGIALSFEAVIAGAKLAIRSLLGA